MKKSRVRHNKRVEILKPDGRKLSIITLKGKERGTCCGISLGGSFKKLSVYPVILFARWFEVVGL